MSDTSAEEKWEKVAADNATRITSTLTYYRQEALECSKWDRRLSTAILLLGVVTPILVTLSINKELTPFWTLTLQLSAIFTAGMLAFAEGFRRIYGYDKRWSKAYMTMMSLQRARAQYKMNRIGLSTGSEEWKKLFTGYQNFFYDLIAKESEDFFKNLELSKK